MQLRDSPALREVLTHFFPSIQIQQIVPAPSGQRVVYFCSFAEYCAVGEYSKSDSQQNWYKWGNVVLKVSQDVHPSVIARLEKEIEILNSLNSIFYPKLYYYDVFSEDPETEAKFQYRLFITVEERINGESLNHCKKRFTKEIAVARLILQLVDGLRHLWEHPQRIVHRDLKPDNILIYPDGSPVIIDLGIIREEGSGGITNTFWQVGPCSPAYASPEQARNDKRNINFRSDFFALGVIAYELLSEKNPFCENQSDLQEEVLQRVIEYEPKKLSVLGRASEPFSNIVFHLMAKQPYQRYRTVDALRQALVNFIEGSQ